MATFTNQSKNSISPSNQSKTSATFTNTEGFVHPWEYNESGYTYNQVADPVSGQPVYYNSAGLQTYTNVTKN